MTTSDAVLGEIERHGIVPVVTLERPEQGRRVAEALLAGGLPLAEITLRTAAAPDAIDQIRSALPEVIVGAGTVLGVDHAAAAVAAGARFVVSPGYDDAVVAWCRARDVLVLPGVMTPTEMMRAVGAGLGAVKLFPASVAGGVRALEAARPVFPALRFVPTGGIGPNELADYLRLDNVVACGGSWMVAPDLVARGDIERIRTRTEEAVQIVGRARGTSGGGEAR